MMNVKLLAILAALISIVFGVILIKKILAKANGDEKMKEIAEAIQTGAKAYLFANTKPLPISLLYYFLF